jgi:hypothetical protein
MGILSLSPGCFWADDGLVYFTAFASDARKQYGANEENDFS